jgi:uncharacterized damage-inducible protein DinB
MKLQEVMLLYEYNYWANHRLLTTAAKVSAEQFTAPGPFPFGGLRGTLVHTLDAEYSWRMLLDKSIMTEDMKETEFATLEAFEKRWKDEEAAMRLYLAGLKDKDMAGIVRYTTAEGVKRERVLWHCLYHLVNHGTQHRSEAAAILTDFGQSPGNIDFTVFLNERK